ncbi:MAG TPA: hypothetical protein DDW52_18420 [Planctomycetaceae bacterium]|nr:hypothetical protein [Planctomycetaceae bacterium]
MLPAGSLRTEADANKALRASPFGFPQRQNATSLAFDCPMRGSNDTIGSASEPNGQTWLHFVGPPSAVFKW